MDMGRVPSAQYPRGFIDLADHLEEFSVVLRHSQETGFDWVFPYIYSKTTGSGQRALLNGEFYHPEFVVAVMSHFYEIYALNIQRWYSGDRPEAGWHFVLKTSRFFSKKFSSRQHIFSNLVAILQTAGSIYVHVLIDLPRSLYAVYDKLSSRLSLKEMKREYFGMIQLFGPAIDDLIVEGLIVPSAFSRCWSRLPKTARCYLSIGHFGVASFLRVMRFLAWYKFRWMVCLSRIRKPSADISIPAMLTTLPLVFSSNQAQARGHPRTYLSQRNGVNC
jgi:hypothetical protein